MATAVSRVAAEAKQGLKNRSNSIYNVLLRPYHAVRRMPELRVARRRIFVDCGANTCTVLRDFVRRFPDFEFFAFEAQPELAIEGQRVIHELPDVKIQHFSKAVWTRNEDLNFYLATRWGANHRGGSTLVTGHTGGAPDYETPIRVEAIDFSSWLAANFIAEDYVIVKMDIEGAEYDVLEKVIADGNLPLIDELIIEFHQHMSENVTKERHDALMETLRRSPCRLVIWH